MKRKIFILLMLLLSVTGGFAQNYTAAQVRQRINATASRMNTMACNFVQTKSMRMVRSKITSRGNMYYSKPNKLRWEYTSPYRYTFILNGQTVWMKNSRNSGLSASAYI